MNSMHIMRRIFNLDFLLSVVIPVIIFYVLNHFNMILQGTILAGSWSLAAIAFQFTRKRKISAFAIIVALFSVIGLVGTIVFHNPTYYLESPILNDFVLGFIFLGSLVIGRPLIQVFAEYEMKDFFPQELRMHPKYISAWKILTAGWGLLNIFLALLRLELLNTTSPVFYYTVCSVIGNVSTPLLLVFSYWFPKWYWRDLKIDFHSHIA